MRGTAYAIMAQRLVPSGGGGGPLLPLVLVLLAVVSARAGHLRESGSEVVGAPSENPHTGPEGGSAEGKDLLANTLLSIADKLEGKAGAESGADPARAEYEDAVMKAVKLLARHQQTKVTLNQVAAAMQKNSGDGKVGKATVGQIVAALRLDPLKPKDPPVDKKKLLATAVGAVEAKLDQLADMLANAKEEPVDKTPEELASHDMQHGLESAPPPELPPPINFRLNMEHPVLPQGE